VYKGYLEIQDKEKSTDVIDKNSLYTRTACQDLFLDLNPKKNLFFIENFHFWKNPKGWQTIGVPLE